MKKSSFYLQRLKNASIRELGYRFRQRLMHRRVRRLHRKKAGFIPVPACSITQVKNLVAPSIHSATAQDTVERILQGFRFSLNGHVSEMEKFEKLFSDVFSPDIARMQKPLDVRQVWEPSRLQHLTALLNWYTQNGNKESGKFVARYIKDRILQWIKQNAFLSGPHYMCSMECGLRIPVFFYVLKILDNLDTRELKAILGTIYRHTWWISKNLSLYSSLGNHTISECVGLIFGGAVFRHTPEGHAWIMTGIQLLKNEASHQILDDGGPVEQSLGYHRFVLDLYWLATDFLEINGIHDCSSWKERLIKGEEFLACFEDDTTDMPSIGDFDDGCAIAPGFSPKRPPVKNHPDLYNIFNNSGVTVIRTANKSMLTFDHGPLGMAPLYNHGHADALSITLQKNRKKFLVDPGTFRYNNADEWRRYFKGTRSHNTVTIDELDQAVQKTNFIWSHPYYTKLVRASKTEDGFIVSAFHSGYTRLRHPVWHQRTIINFKENNFIIKDTFSGKGCHTYELNYHLHPHVETMLDKMWWMIGNNGAKVFVRLFDEYEFDLVRGEKDPIHGWYSSSYGKFEESPILTCRKQGLPHKVTFLTAICTEQPLDKHDVMERAQCI